MFVPKLCSVLHKNVKNMEVLGSEGSQEKTEFLKTDFLKMWIKDVKMFQKSEYFGIYDKRRWNKNLWEALMQMKYGSVTFFFLFSALVRFSFLCLYLLMR